MCGASLPFSGNVIFVPFFHPGFMSIVRISSTTIVLLHYNKGLLVRSQMKSQNATDIKKSSENEDLI
jgi:hypothetical protein